MRGLEGVPRAVKIRAYVATSLLTLLLGGVAYKAWGLQVGDADEFRVRALRQHAATVEIPAPRGAIVDAQGRALAVTADVDSVYADPRGVKDLTATAEKLAPILGLDEGVLEAKLSVDKGFQWIARHVTPAQSAAVKAAKLAGIEVTSEPARWYPGRASGGPVIGVAGVDGNGLDGIELRFDKQLTGERAKLTALRDARGKTALADGIVDATPGATVQLTLDSAIQSTCDAALDEAITKNQAKAGIVIVEDVATGAILCMASSPSYDPNDPGRNKDARNRAVTDTFEIGSIMKLFTLSAAFDAHVTNPDEWWNVEHGLWMFAGRPIRDTHHDDEMLTTAGIFKKSSNVGAAKIGLRLGAERLHDALIRFGLGHKTGVELPHEEPGAVRAAARWRDIDLTRIAFGYGVTVTPLQVAAMVAAIGDGGLWHTPHLVAKITDAAGNVVYEPKIEEKQIMEARTARWMLPIMASVFDKADKHGKNGGTAHDIDIDGFRAGAKTATAHKIDPATHRYADDLYISSFAGIAPISAPRIAVVVVIDEPHGKEYYGGAVAGPVFAKVVSSVLRYLGVPGDAPPAPAAPDAKPAPDDVDDDAPPVDDAPPPLPDALPDFRGMSIAHAMAAARDAGVTIEIVGSGRATDEEPQSDGTIKVIFR